VSGWDVLRVVFPERVVSAIIVAGSLLILGWYANVVWAQVHQHYEETTVLVEVNKYICAGVYKHAGIKPPPVCEVPQP